jgi:O-antigen ligase
MKLFAPERLQRLELFFWALTLVTVPLTSFTFMPFIGNNTQVRPFSLFPALILLVLLGIRCIQKRCLLFWSNALVPLILFGMVAVFSSAAGLFMAPVSLFGNAYGARVLRAWITFAAGIVFLLTSIGMNRDEQGLRFTLKWLYIGFFIQAGWSLVQLFAFYLPNQQLRDAAFSLVNSIQATFVVSGLAPHQRISGLTLEPSWLAAQVVAAYLPWAFASLLTNYRWDRRGWLAPLILAINIFLLIFTFSRSGILITLVAVLLSVLLTGRKQIQQGWHWFLSPFRRVKPAMVQRTTGLVLRVFIILAILAGFAGGLSLLAQNSYFATLWNSQKTDVVSYLAGIYAGPRLAYAWAGWTVFEHHPWTGVGLGAVGLYLYQALPDWALFDNPEIAQLLNSLTYLNTKDLFIRLLAETGIVGFWLFISFYLVTLGKTLALLRSRRKELVFVGTASLMAWLAIIALGFTQDSLAMLTIWMPLGILIGMAGEDKP